MNILYFIVFAGASIVYSWCWTRSSDRDARLLYGVYALSYFITSVIGATVLAFSNGEIWDILNFGVDTSSLQPPGLLYWFLLYSPFFIVPAMISFVRRFQSKRRNEKTQSVTYLSLLAYMMVFAVFSSYCFLLLYRAGALGNMFGGLKAQDYQDFIGARVELLEFAKTPFYGVIYMSLPALCTIAMFQMFRTKQMRWRITFVISAAVAGLLSLSTMLKGPIFLLFCVFLCAAHALGRLRFSRISIAGAAVLAAFTLWQGLFFSGWTALASLYMFFFRMAHSYPFYVSLFPKHVSYLGSNFGLAMFGAGGGNNDNLIVFDRMYPTVTWVQGAVAAPAHLRAFAQAGLPYAIASLVVIGIILAALASLRRSHESPYQFAVLVQGMLVAYYVTQTSIRGVCVESFSIVFGALAIAALWILNRAIVMATQNSRAAVFARLNS